MDCFHFMSFITKMLRELGMAFCISEVFPILFKSCVEVSVGSSYITFVAVGVCQFIYRLPIVFVILFYLIIECVVQFVIFLIT